jgi:hypothetical protein
MPDREADDEKMTRALAVWAKRKNLRPADFEDAMGWSYNHSWRVLRGRDKFTPSAYGQFILAYGMAELKEIFRIAGLDPSGVQEEH